MLRLFTIACLLFSHSVLFGQIAKHFFENMEVKLTTGIGYHDMGDMNYYFGKTTFENLGTNDDVFRIRNDQWVEDKPYTDITGGVFFRDFVFTGFPSFEGINADYLRTALDIRYHPVREGFLGNSCIGIQISRSGFFSRNSQLTSQPMILQQEGVYDSVFVNFNNQADTILAIPRVRTVQFSTRLSSIDFGFTYGIRLKGDVDSRFRSFLTIGSRIRMISSKANATLKYENYAGKRIIYQGYQTINTTNGDVAALSVINFQGRDDQEFEVDIPNFYNTAYFAQLNFDWRLGYFPAFLGAEMETGIQTYRLGSDRVHQSYQFEFRLFLIVRPSLVNEWKQNG